MLVPLISLLAGFSAYFTYVGIWRKRQAAAAETAVQQRLREFQEQSRLGEELLDDDGQPRRAPGAMHRLGSGVGDLLALGAGGSNIMEKIEEKLVLSGRPHGWYAQDWVAFSALSIGGAVIGGGILVQVMQVPKLIYFLLVGLTAYYTYWELAGRIKSRQEQARFELPYFLDELIMSLSSGAGSLDLALRDIVAGDTAVRGRQDSERVLVTEFRRAYQESANQARSFAEAYREASARIQVQAVDDMVEVLIEGQSSGAPILGVLRDMSQQVYTQYEQDVTTLIKKKDSTFTVATVIIMLGAAIVIGAPVVQSVGQSLSGGLQ